MGKVKRDLRILIGMIVLYVVIFGAITGLRHYNFQTQAMDMGVFVQTMWNTVHGRIMFNNFEEPQNHLGVHMSPWLFVLVPGYAVFQSPYYLLIVQTIALALGALPLYYFALRILGQNKPAIIITAGYLLYPSLHWVNLFDFHPVAFFVPLLLAALYFLEIERWWLAAVFLVSAASTKENAILVVLFAGIFLMLKKSDIWFSIRRKIGLSVIILALLYFVISVKIIMPALGGGLLRLDRYMQFGGTMGEIINTMITRPDILVHTLFNAQKALYLLWIFLPMAFFPLISWRAVILMIPGLLQNLLTSFGSQFTSLYQYDSILIPALWIGFVYGYQRVLIRFPNRESAIRWIMIMVFIAGFIFRSPLNPISFPAEYFRDNPRREAYKRMVLAVPDGVSVTANTNIVPHLAQREDIYMLGTEPEAVDVLLADGADSFGFSGTESLEFYVQNYINSGAYNAYLIKGRYLILSKKGIRMNIERVPES